MITLSDANLESLEGEVLREKGCRADVLRLDAIHPVISGNKWFKLKYYLEDMAARKARTMITFGGAYSNHIVAAACAAQACGFRSVGIIRGEEPRQLSPTLRSAQDYGMRLKFVSREIYRQKPEAPEIRHYIDSEPDPYVIPEGGAGEKGVQGAADMLSLADLSDYSHIMCAIGTGTMFAGVLQASSGAQQVLGVPVLKGIKALPAALTACVSGEKWRRARFYDTYHFGGYAKKTASLLEFMNVFYGHTGIPSDFVYTGKLFYAFADLLKKDLFKPGSRLLLIHSGGLQGNNSLPPGTLRF